MLIDAVSSVPMSAHDLERTQVSIRFARDGAFTLDVANDPNWLKLRQEPFRGNFVDRIVLFVDGHEIRPSSIEYLAPATRPESADALATYRMRGRMPVDAHTLRWYYGLVVDPYPLAVIRADGRIVVEEVAGDAWSRTIDLSGQFKAPWLSERLVVLLVAGLFLVPITMRVASPRRKDKRHQRHDGTTGRV